MNNFIGNINYTNPNQYVNQNNRQYPISTGRTNYNQSLYQSSTILQSIQHALNQLVNQFRGYPQQSFYQPTPYNYNHYNYTQYGSQNNDYLFGAYTNNAMYGGRGNDHLYGNAFNDRIHGGRGNDRLYGHFGNDYLVSGRGNDYLSGGYGHDHLNIRAGGNNTVDGGQGYDTAYLSGRPIDYVFKSASQAIPPLGTHAYYPQAGVPPLSMMDRNSGAVNQISNVESLMFEGLGGRPQTVESLLNNPWLTGREDIMLYGDPIFNRIVAIKPSTMQQVGNINMPGQEIYAADHITDDKSYVMARGSNFMNVLERNPLGEFNMTKQIELPFHPRTGAKNLALGLELVTGTDKPMYGLVDMKSDQLVASGGLNQVTQGSVGNFDGELATGHGIWLNKNQFVLPDRANKLLQLYNVTKNDANTVNGGSEWNVELQDVLNLPSSVHTIHGGKDPNTFYLPIEGSPQNGVAAGFSELFLQGDKLVLGRTANVPGDNLADQGTHHPEMHPDGKHFYVGSNEGFVHLVDSDSMDVVKSIPAGKGAGHVTFIPERNLALVTNHHDTFVTAIDMTTHEHIKDIPVAVDSPQYDTALQAHTGRVSPDKQYFYNFASDSGTFFRINLDTLETDSQLYTGGTPKQASQPGELTYGVELA